MRHNPRHIDLSGLPRAIDFEAQVARNREIIQALPEPATDGEDTLEPIENWLDVQLIRNLL